ncbi:hypothetical protein BX666DRAFT_1891721 [Dichotomocladium elegans]|nr:hypothetical protein BX666DRAFT_1891721 [Dichotomocladium elegans]
MKGIGTPNDSTASMTTTALSSSKKKKGHPYFLLLSILGFVVLCSLGLDTMYRRYHDVCTDAFCDISEENQSFLHHNQQQQQQQNTAADKDDATVAEKKEYPYTIVTASSANHLCALESFLYALNALRSEVQQPFPRLVVYNIGMNRTQLPVLDQLQARGMIDDLVTFDYFRYPRFWDVAINAGEYAWKTGIVEETAKKYGGVLVWLDAGNMVTAEFLDNIATTIRSKGFWSPRSPANMAKWTHPGMFAYYNENPSDFGRYANCNGAAIGFDTTNATVMELIEGWYQCGLDKRCIAPPGSSRANHRQDQAALTYLVWKMGFSCARLPSDFYDLQIHRDISCAANLLGLEVQNKLHHPSSIDYEKWQRSDTLNLYNHPEWRYPEDQVPEHIKAFMNPPVF